MNRNINLYDCRKDNQQLKANKTPGIDDLAAEFYKNYFDIIWHAYSEVMEYTYRKWKISATKKIAVIALIYKKGDRRNMK